ncbi:MAG: hypothetical protein G3M70_07305 [Candidatus Nitronauta litoralis]|uniref:Uncharacterized protein n=1 Tax=Candidatus Nitronauta litoralis TaxID=2705533 RepID=A0A7T0BWE0_9BACT|nr:MAG: hypothetical protein G3M70_07305 [Candidatus Nitronauta litoralis]
MAEGSLAGLDCATCHHKDCDGGKGLCPPYEYNGEPITGCPLNYATAETRMMMRYFKHYQNGFLPTQGGITDQPNILMRAFEILDSIVAEHREEEAERERQRAKRNGR